jgi:hypothetical protein
MTKFAFGILTRPHNVSSGTHYAFWMNKPRIWHSAPLIETARKLGQSSKCVHDGEPIYFLFSLQLLLRMGDQMLRA